MQLNMFQVTKPTFKIDKNKKIRMIEFFSGIGCQKMALERITDNFEIVGISEIDKYAIKSYEAMHGETKNFGDITKIKGNDIPKDIDILTYSFPCTDLSKAGQQKGLFNTRSGLVHEVIRLLQELKQNDNLPKILVMENVVDLVQTKFIRQFQEIQLELEQLGYNNYTQTLNSKDYGVAQNRDRVFMVSILGDYNYTFPSKIELEKRLKDYLQPLEEIEDKYYLSEKTLATFTDTTNRNGYVRSDKFNPQERSKKYSFCVTTREACVPTANYIKEEVKVKEATKKGYAIAKDGDSINLDQPSSKTRRGRVGKQQAQTLTTSCNQAVVVQKGRGYNPGGEYENCPSITTSSWQENNYIKNNTLIRKITPLEAWRLMGIDDHYFYKAQKVNSNSQLYKQAGNGIVIDVLEAIFRQLF